MSHSRQHAEIPLATGVLTLKLLPGRIPLHRLLGFAARISSKRKFLFVSKLLGKHYPVSPLLMRWSYRKLARDVLAQELLGASLWLGMAETATGLGYGVYAEAKVEGLEHALFMQTTRYVLSGYPFLQFEESHSHATDFFLYFPNREEDKRLFNQADTLVLIDDEISTGTTFLHLIQAYRQLNPQLKKVVIVSLVNFAEPERRIELAEQAGVNIAWVYLRSGRFAFTDSHNAVVDTITVNVDSSPTCKKAYLAWPGRLGITKPIQLAQDCAKTVQAYFTSSRDDTRPLLVLGTGECNAPAYLLASQLTALGFKVKVQSTTRSPIYPGNDIANVCQFTDNYGDNIPNFLYNFTREHYREVIICHETPLNDVILARLTAWQAISARFELTDTSAPDASLYFYRP